MFPLYIHKPIALHLYLRASQSALQTQSQGTDDFTIRDWRSCSPRLLKARDMASAAMEASLPHLYNLRIYEILPKGALRSAREGTSDLSFEP